MPPSIHARLRMVSVAVTLCWLSVSATAIAQPLPVVSPLVPNIDSAERVAAFAGRFPLCIVITESFANEFVRQETTEQGPVRDFILGANVVGNQQTTARAELDLVPSEEVGRWLMALDGTVANQTVSYTPQAAIRSSGNYRFQLSKQVDFDGAVFKTRSPAAFLSVNQLNTGALTPAGGVPIVGPIASMIAITEADRRKPLADQIAASRVTQQVGPRFNQEVDSQLATLNQLLETVVRAQLERFSLLPTRMQTASTSDAFLWGMAIRETESPIDAPPALTLSLRTIHVAIHESHLNDLLEKAPLRGVEMPDTVFDLMGRWTEEFNATGSAPSVVEDAVVTGGPQLGGEFGEEILPEASLATVIFDEQQPLQFKLRDGVIELEARMAFRPTLGPVIPTRRLSFQTEPVIAEGQLTLAPRLKSIDSVDNTADANQFLAGVADQALRQQVESKLTSLVTSTERAFTIPELNRPATIRMTTFAVQNQWLILSWELETAPATDACPVLPTDGWQPVTMP